MTIAIEFIYTGGTAAVADIAARVSRIVAGTGAKIRRLAELSKEAIKKGSEIIQFVREFISNLLALVKKDPKLLTNKFIDILNKIGIAIRKELGMIDEVIQSQAELERRVDDLFDHLGGKLYAEKELKLLKVKLKEEYGVDLRLIDKELGYEKLPVTKNGKTKWVRSSELFKDWELRGVVGKFHEGPPPVMILRSNNASELTVFHEKVHLEIWYNKLPKMHIVDEEKMVFEAIWKARNEMRWTENELIDAYDYVNKKIIQPHNYLGKKFPKLKNEQIEQFKINKLLNIR